MKNKFLWAFLCLGLLLVYFNCEKDEVTVKEKQEIKTSNGQITPTIKNVSYANVGNKFNQLKSKFQLDEYLQLESVFNVLARETIDTLGITIYIDDIKEITLDDYTSYTMRIVLPDSDSEKFYNLTIEDKNGVEAMFMTKYTPTEEWKNDKSKPYEGNVKTARIDVITNEFPPDGGAGIIIGNITTTDEYPTDCDGYVETTVIYIPIPCECEPHHPPGECDPYEPCSVQGYWQPVTSYVCYPFDFGGNDDGSSSTTNPNDNGTGDGDETSSSSNSPSATAVMSDPECTGGKIKDSQGVCVCPNGKIDNGNGVCVCPNGYTENWRKDCVRLRKCEELSKLTQSYPGTTNPYINGDNKSIRIALTNIDDYLDPQYNSEHGYGLYNLGEFPTYGPYAHYIPPQENRKVRFPGKAYMFGTIHTHPSGLSNLDYERTIPMFSLEDVYTLLSVRNRYNSGPPYLTQNNPNGDDLFVSLLVVKQGGETITYAIKIENMNDLQGLNSVFNNKKRLKKWIKKLKKKYEEDANNAEGTPNQYHKAFLEFANDYNLGVSLFEMGQDSEGTPGVNENWTELNLNDQGEVISTPCNL